MTALLQKIAIVIPTIGRDESLRRMIQSVITQTRLPDEIVVVDEGGEGHALAREFPSLRVKVNTYPKGSASAKRNRGAQFVTSDIHLIAFMDDDIVLEPHAIESMLKYWATAEDDLGGASFNWINQPTLFARHLKSLGFVGKLSLYDIRGGVVSKSGFHTVIGAVHETRTVQWLPSGAVVYPRFVLDEQLLDEWYQGYSYLEDLDFSYPLGKKYKLAVVADARYYHYPSNIGRVGSYAFGKMEVANRLHFVSKHPELSQVRCSIALVIRFFISIFLGVRELKTAYFRRAWGNVVGLATAFWRRV